METTNSVLALMPSNKAEISSFVNKVIESITSGEVNPLKVDFQLKCIETTLDGIRKNDQVKAAVLREAEKYGAKSFDYSGAKCEISEAGVKYDFSVCNDIVLSDLLKQDEELQAEIKKRKDLLKAISPGFIMVNSNTGESWEVFPPAKSSQTILKYKL